MALDVILEISDFSNPYKVFEKHTNNDGFEKYYNDILAKSQKDFLINILGHQLYNTLKTSYPDSGFYSGLIDGKTYTDDSISYVYLGVKEALLRHSYYWWQQNNIDRLQSSGSLQQDFKESKKVIPKDKMIRAWNEMIELINGSVLYEPTIYHYIDTQYTGEVWKYIGFEKQNIWGI